ncbi:HAD family hydrolase [Paludicola sp. MB14-C6]|uniref:HAD family hydrolase n=1 Tax=Paludihabitans sp. MB14-C6 TaxID=3070656 RepID=UPI0035A2B0E6
MKYKAIYFDWDGTAVASRISPADKILRPMIELLKKGVKLIIISGTTYNNIAFGKIHELIPVECQANLFLGLGRGAYNYGIKEGKPYLLSENILNVDKKSKLDKVCFDIHQCLWEKYSLHTDIVFSRPNYCKIDLMVDNDRKDSLFLQENEIDCVNEMLREHKIEGGLKQLIDLSETIGNNNNMPVKATTDAKYLEVGITTKSDNVDYFVNYFHKHDHITIEDCCFCGDEFTCLSDGVYGSDSQMITQRTKTAKFLDVSVCARLLPKEVDHIGGGVEGFQNFLESQI